MTCLDFLSVPDTHNKQMVQGYQSQLHHTIYHKHKFYIKIVACSRTMSELWRHSALFHSFNFLLPQCILKLEKQALHPADTPNINIHSSFDIIFLKPILKITRSESAKQRSRLISEISLPEFRLQLHRLYLLLLIV